MIGGRHETTGSILRVHGSPPSLPSFVSDVGFAFADYVNAQSLRFASTGEAQMPLVDPQGGRDALQAEIGGFNMGSPTIRSGRRAATASRSSTSPIGRTATSTPSATCRTISIRPRCAARSSSRRRRGIFWRAYSTTTTRNLGVAMIGLVERASGRHRRSVCELLDASRRIAIVRVTNDRDGSGCQIEVRSFGRFR